MPYMATHAPRALLPGPLQPLVLRLERCQEAIFDQASKAVTHQHFCAEIMQNALKFGAEHVGLYYYAGMDEDLTWKWLYAFLVNQGQTPESKRQLFSHVFSPSFKLKGRLCDRALFLHSAVQTNPTTAALDEARPRYNALHSLISADFEADAVEFLEVSETLRNLLIQEAPQDYHKKLEDSVSTLWELSPPPDYPWSENPDLTRLLTAKRIDDALRSGNEYNPTRLSRVRDYIRHTFEAHHFGDWQSPSSDRYWTIFQAIVQTPDALWREKSSELAQIYQHLFESGPIFSSENAPEILQLVQQPGSEHTDTYSPEWVENLCDTVSCICDKYEESDRQTDFRNYQSWKSIADHIAPMTPQDRSCLQCFVKWLPKIPAHWGSCLTLLCKLEEMGFTSEHMQFCCDLERQDWPPVPTEGMSLTHYLQQLKPRLTIYAFL